MTNQRMLSTDIVLSKEVSTSLGGIAIIRYPLLSLLLNICVLFLYLSMLSHYLLVV